MPTIPSSLAFVTGTSSGIGEALARELLGRGWAVVGMARREAAIEHPRYTHLQLDLANLGALRSSLDGRIAALVSDRSIARLGLVNNAAVEALLGPVSKLDAAALMDVYAINTAAPVLLMGWFQRHARANQLLRIVNISTGAASKPLPGLAAYANTKAALRMAGMVMAAELDQGRSADANQPDTSILSFEPGVVDTPMQVKLRSSSSETLPAVELFRGFSDSGALQPAAGPAKVMADYLDADGHQTWEERRFQASR